MSKKQKSTTRSRLAYAVLAIVIVAAFVLYWKSESFQLAPQSGQTNSAFLPTFNLTEGASNNIFAGYPNLYQPDPLIIPATTPARIRLTDYAGGCGLETVFVGLGPNGTSVSATVPVGNTSYVNVYAPSPGNYTVHCGADMYWGEIKAV